MTETETGLHTLAYIVKLHERTIVDNDSTHNTRLGMPLYILTIIHSNVDALTHQQNF